MGTDEGDEWTDEASEEGGEKDMALFVDSVPNLRPAWTRARHGLGDTETPFLSGFWVSSFESKLIPRALPRFRLDQPFFFGKKKKSAARLPKLLLSRDDEVRGGVRPSKTVQGPR